MTKQIPTRRCDTEANHRRITRTELEQLSDWALRDIGLFRQVPALDAVKPFWMV